MPRAEVSVNSRGHSPGSSPVTRQLRDHPAPPLKGSLKVKGAGLGSAPEAGWDASSCVAWDEVHNLSGPRCWATPQTRTRGAWSPRSGHVHAQSAVTVVNNTLMKAGRGVTASPQRPHDGNKSAWLSQKQKAGQGQAPRPGAQRGQGRGTPHPRPAGSGHRQGPGQAATLGTVQSWHLPRKHILGLSRSFLSSL